MGQFGHDVCGPDVVDGHDDHCVHGNKLYIITKYNQFKLYFNICYFF